MRRWSEAKVWALNPSSTSAIVDLNGLLPNLGRCLSR